MVTLIGLVGAFQKCPVVRRTGRQPRPGRARAALVCGAAWRPYRFPWVIPALYGVDYQGQSFRAQILSLVPSSIFRNGLWVLAGRAIANLGRAHSPSGRSLPAPGRSVSVVPLGFEGDILSLVLVEILLLRLVTRAIGFVATLLPGKRAIDASYRSWTSAGSDHAQAGVGGRRGRRHQSSPSNRNLTRVPATQNGR